MLIWKKIGVGLIMASSKVYMKFKNIQDLLSGTYWLPVYTECKFIGYLFSIDIDIDIDEISIVLWFGVNGRKTSTIKKEEDVNVGFTYRNLCKDSRYICLRNCSQKFIRERHDSHLKFAKDGIDFGGKD